jgi:DnaK suppressor protein
VVKNMANSKHKPAAKKPATKKSAAARPAKKPAARKPAPKGPARAKSTAKASPRKAAKPIAKKPAHKPAAKKPARPAPVKSTRKAAPHKPAPAPKKGKMSAVIEKDSVTREDGRYALPSTTIIELPANYRPCARVEYMGPKQLAYFRAKVQRWRDDLVEESKQTIDNLRDEVRDVGDEAERATRETENSLELRTRDRYRKLIAKIDKALKRIEEGRYGFCEETDEEIGLERLDARPIATLCLDAQERWEHRQKQMGD